MKTGAFFLFIMALLGLFFINASVLQEKTGNNAVSSKAIVAQAQSNEEIARINADKEVAIAEAHNDREQIKADAANTRYWLSAGTSLVNVVGGLIALLSLLYASHEFLNKIIFHREQMVRLAPPPALPPLNEIDLIGRRLFGNEDWDAMKMLADNRGSELVLQDKDIYLVNESKNEVTHLVPTAHNWNQSQ